MNAVPLVSARPFPSGSALPHRARAGCLAPTGPVEQPTLGRVVGRRGHAVRVHPDGAGRPGPRWGGVAPGARLVRRAGARRPRQATSRATRARAHRTPPRRRGGQPSQRADPARRTRSCRRPQRCPPDVYRPWVPPDRTWLRRAARRAAVTELGDRAPGSPTVPPEHAVIQTGLLWGPVEAVIAGDHLLRQGQLDGQELERVLAGYRGRAGVVPVARALGWAHAGAGCRGRACCDAPCGCSTIG